MGRSEKLPQRAAKTEQNNKVSVSLLALAPELASNKSISHLESLLEARELRRRRVVERPKSEVRGPAERKDPDKL